MDASHRLIGKLLGSCIGLLKLIRTMNVVGLTLLLTFGCASNPLTSVSESNKDTTGSYDGRWKGTITNTPPQQPSTGSYPYVNCYDLSGRKLGTFTVRDGQLEYYFRSKRLLTYVNASGGFRLPISLDAGGFSLEGGTFTASKDSLTISGSLKTGKGNHVTASADLKGAGCKSSVVFEKV